jgi:hypothetical protein
MPRTCACHPLAPARTRDALRRTSSYDRPSVGSRKLYQSTAATALDLHEWLAKPVTVRVIRLVIDPLSGGMSPSSKREYDNGPLARELAPDLWAPVGDLVVAPAVRPEMVADPDAAGEAEDFLRRVALALGADRAPESFAPDN